MLIFKYLNVIITYLFLLLFFFLLADISLSEEINKQSTLFIKADKSLECNRKEQIIFAEINYDNIDSVRGLNVTINTTANSDSEAYWLLKEMGLPLIDKPKKNKMDEAA